MKRSKALLGLWFTTAITLALLPGGAAAQQKLSKEQLVGVWTLVSNDNTMPDGTKRQLFGSNPKGILIFDTNGRYAQTFVRPDRPKFKANNRLQGSPEEIKAGWDGVIAHFGTWSVSDTDNTVTLRIEGASYPNQEGTEAKRIVSSLTSDELKWTNPATGSGGKTDAAFRRAK